MIDSRMALDPNRLPWLADERAPVRKKVWQPLLPWVLLAMLLVAGASYWVGMNSVTQGDEFTEQAPPPPAATIKLPAPAAELPAPPEIKPVPLPEVEPVRAPAPVRIATPAPAPVRVRKPQPAASAAAESSREPKRKDSDADDAPAAKPVVAARPAPLRPWPSAQSAGADGRLVRIGTFRSRAQAKRGWRQVMRAYPGMGRLRAVVVPNTSLRDGRTYYRLQFGTTSHAHSAVLCQRMRMIAQSCVVIGSPSGRGG